MQHMTLKMRVFFIFLTTILYHSDIALGQANRKWVQIDNRLFRIDPNARVLKNRFQKFMIFYILFSFYLQYSWEMAVKECKKEHTHLIRPETNYDYTQLKGAIKRNYRKYAGKFVRQRNSFTLFKFLQTIIRPFGPVVK